MPVRDYVDAQIFSHALGYTGLIGQEELKVVGQTKYDSVDFIGKSGAYTRKRGLDRDTNKELLLKHIRDSASKGARFQDLTQVLPMLTRRQIQKLLDELRSLKLIDKEGTTRSALWHPASIAPQ